ncbi:GNAT family N-acetyltransferase [Streptomyces sp. PTY087I2]|uniref:GNAT family N-acetyltransferase n=1 Tax=Streptomyces sp. PTY087I2 TaxID=1819298 RepID=UPI00159EC59A|nr:GNAT family N-acetyltransferase [Streptomyces sp. PTY087I2]
MKEAMRQELVRLRLMTEAEYAEYEPYVIADYAQRNVAAGTFTQGEAMERARTDFAKLLPQGASTADNYLHAVEDPSGERVGNLWYAIRRSAGNTTAFILNMEIFAEHQGRGFGRGLLHACAQDAAGHGARAVEIQILGSEDEKRSLFRSVGMLEKRIVMTWNLKDSGEVEGER